MKYYGQYKEYPVDKMLYDRYFPEKKGGFCIECGALDGLSLNSCKFFEESMGWDCVNVEPHPISYERLRENRPNSYLNLNLALGKENGHGELIYSIKPNRLKMASFFKNNIVKHHRKVETKIITYKALIVEQGIDEVDLFILDTEGTELDIIEGMRDCHVLPDVFCIELHHPSREVDIYLEALSQLNVSYNFDFTYKLNTVFKKDQYERIRKQRNDR